MIFQRLNAFGVEEIECDMIQPFGNLEGEDANKMVFYLYKEVQKDGSWIMEQIAIVPVVELFTIC